MRKLACFLFFLSFLRSYGQIADSSDSASLIVDDSLVRIYYSHQQEGVYALYNGRQFYGYPASIEEHAFFLSRGWYSGSVFYDGLWYRNIDMMYDIYRDELVVKHPNGVAVILFGERVREFSFEGHFFVYLQADKKNGIKEGFYHRLAQGRATVYAKRTKLLEEKIDGLRLERKFISKDVFFIYKEGNYYPVKKQSALFNILKEKGNEVQQFRSRLNIRYKTNPEQVIVSTAEYYNTIYP